ncbi:trimethylamine methyltransferase family protein [Desulfosarcina sp.]|uniref:trimethylamine methyltransferase family protein n=1 Tax=Desulfosarcina sp. TaxID=2027861 RepID=UPI0029A01AEF|nr:trimethylamine methyltransferase family protein [Desulfosarcina sp.]MDX2454983.1 trimethylamine methyltransferase family protein [Desulfosarcina sp.]MDX2492558.1 trimethylamine methyltransferase family protein [Desulfosarcina sp.]
MKEKLTAIHNQALRILETVGIKLHHAELIQRIRQPGVSVKNNTVFFTPDFIMDAVRRAPASFTLHGRNPGHDMVIGGDHVNCAPGYGCAAICAPDGTRRSAVMADYVRLAKLVHQCPHFKVNGGILAQPSDVPADQSHLLMLYAAIVSSDKCLMGVPGNRLQMQALMDLAAIAFGGRAAFSAKPHLLTLISTISPLQIDENALDAMIIASHLNQPVIISPSPAAGTTGPIDMAANISLAAAEALAGIAIVQTIRPGTPVIFGLQCLVADLRTGNISIGSPAYTLQSKYTAALARMYHLPSRCGGTLTDAPDLSPQSGYESMLNMLTTFQNGVNLIVHSAGTLDSFAAISYEKLIMDIQIIDMVKYYLNDLDVNPDTLNLELIRRVGPGGQFLTTMDTLNKCRSHSWNPVVSVCGNTGGGSPSDQFLNRITDRQRAMLDSYFSPPLDRALLVDLDDWMVRQGVDRSLLSTICSQAWGDSNQVIT